MLLLVCVGVMSFGATGAAGAASPPPDPIGFHRVNVAKAEFSIAVPSSWITFDFTRPSVQSRYRQFRLENPHALTIPPTLATFAPQTQLYASDPTWPNEVRVELSPGLSRLPPIRQLRTLVAREPARSVPTSRPSALTVIRRSERSARV